MTFVTQELQNKHKLSETVIIKPSNCQRSTAMGLERGLKQALCVCIYRLAVSSDHLIFSFLFSFGCFSKRRTPQS